eukprot:Lankesteria_metandrocarpae@DN930_c0_g1_i1.p1
MPSPTNIGTAHTGTAHTPGAFSCDSSVAVTGANESHSALKHYYCGVSSATTAATASVGSITNASTGTAATSMYGASQDLNFGACYAYRSHDHEKSVPMYSALI